MRWGGTATLLAITFVAANAAAADAGTGEDVESLLKQLNSEHTALSTHDCVTACKALASIRRAADKICGLEPGPRCVDARAKADDAQRRVQAACPDCQLAAVPGKEEDRRAAQPTTAPPAPAPPAGGSDSAQMESAPRKGGCASCSTPGGSANGDFSVVIVGAWAIARVLRKKSSRRV